MRRREDRASLCGGGNGSAVAIVTAGGLSLRQSRFPQENGRYRRVREFISGELGICMPESNIPMLQHRIERRMNELHIESFDDYEYYLFSPASGRIEQAHLLDIATTNKTEFFREQAHFDYLAREILAATGRVSGFGALPYRVWCAGCSTGQEPYTLAMVLSEFERMMPGFSFSIHATDISTRVLETARNGIYEASLMDGVPGELQRRYFLRSVNPAHRLVCVKPELRARVRFSRLNFMDRDYAGIEQSDCVFFRNVLIYFDKPTQEAVVNRICRHLKPGGYLFTGHSESLMNLDVPVESVGPAIYRKPL